MPKPVVSIVCITYNHAPYIRETLDSFLMQETDFPIEVLIHDDASTDGTTKIIKEYQKKHPAIIKPMIEQENQYVTGDFSFINRMYDSAQGKYIAFCEGDDFWTDPKKLQLQVDHMEARPDLALCFHPTRVFYEHSEEPDSTYPDPATTRRFNIDELIKRNFIQSNSVLYRRAKSYANLPGDVIPSDWYMHLYHAQYGKIGFINRIMSAYRRQPGGVWWETHANIDKIWVKWGVQHLGLYVEMLKLFGESPRSKVQINHHIMQMLSTLRKIDAEHGSNKIEQSIARFPEIVAEYVVAEYKAHEHEVRQLKKHMDEQAKIIGYLDEKTKILEARTADLENQNKHLVRTLGTRATAKLRHAIKKP